jgi:hypothetical protein
VLIRIFFGFMMHPSVGGTPEPIQAETQMDVPSPHDPKNASIRHIREVATARVQATSLRRVAREIGMSPTGLRKFLDGTEPYTPTLHRLRVWFVRFAATPAGEVSHEEASAALAILTHDLSPTPRRMAAQGMLDLLARGYEVSGRARPAWVADLREEYPGPEK